MTNEQDRQQTIDTIRKLIDEIHVAMLTTSTSDSSLRSRPMVTARHEFDGDVWFFTQADDPKVAELKANPHVNVAYASPNHDKYVSLSGKAELVTESKRVETLWTEELKEWFPEGTDNGKLALIRVDVTEAEYWDHKAGRLGGFVKSMLPGDQKQEGEHEKIQWREAVTVT